MRTIALGLSLAGLLLSPQAEANDLMKAYQEAQQRDQLLIAARNVRDASVESRPQARSALLPQIGVEGGVSRERLHYPDETDPESATLFGNSNYYGLSLNQTLLDISAFQTLRAADASAAGAEATFQSAKQQLMLRVAQAYFSNLAAADTLDTYLRSRDAFGQLLEQARSRFDAGLSGSTAVKEAQSFYDLTASNIIDAQIALRDARNALAQIVGATPDSLAPLRDQIPLESPQPLDAAKWVDGAQQNNYDLRAAELGVKAQSHNLSSVRAQHLPTIELQGSSTMSNYDKAIDDDERVDSIGVVVSIPIFTGGLISSRTREAKAQLGNAQAQFEYLKQSIDRETRDAYEKVVEGIHRIKVNQQALASTKAALEAAKDGQQFGTRTEFDVLNAQNTYNETLAQYHTSRYRYLTAVLTLKELAGVLSEDDLKAIDDMLAQDRQVVLNPPRMSMLRAASGSDNASADSADTAPPPQTP